MVATCIEQGGGGGDIAGPVGAQVMGALLATVEGKNDEIGSVEASSGKSVKIGGSATARSD